MRLLARSRKIYISCVDVVKKNSNGSCLFVYLYG